MKTLGMIYEEYYPLVLNYAKKRMSEADAEDSTHNVFFKIMTNPHWLAKITSLLDEPEKIKAILLSFLHNECIDLYRHIKITNKIFVDMPDSEIGASPEQQYQKYQNADILALVMADINQLDEPNRNIFIKRRIKGYSIEQLAEEFKLSPHAIECRISRISNDIKNKWGKIFNDEQ
ncbi:MAG: sigma-70 family RNA polymerase sigma factor [Bacteroidales bacterium]|jgi:RNA polymerase sigma factor (sigma-70 family)|nr:sigma-70 family RNA polymerase sigma factor [Bacteroidales bacterium]